MDEDNVDELGPVDWIVVEFPGSRFNGEMAPRCVTWSSAIWSGCSTCSC